MDDKSKSTSSTKTTTATAKDKLVEPETEQAVKKAADAVKGTTNKAKTTASEKAKELKATAGEVAGEVKGEARTQFEGVKAQADSAKGQAKAKAGELKHQAQDRAQREMEERKAQAAGALNTTASDLRKASDAVEESWMTKAFAVAAEQVEDITRSIENKSPSELQEVARNAARNHPGVFLAGCFAAGVALTRTLKVAAAEQRGPVYSDDDHEQRGSMGSRTGTVASTGTSGSAYTASKVSSGGVSSSNLGTATGTTAGNPSGTSATDLGRQ